MVTKGWCSSWSTDKLKNANVQCCNSKHNVIGCFVIYSFVENMDSFLARYKNPIK